MSPLDTFIQKYPPAAPRRTPANTDECRHLVLADGVLDLDPAPAHSPVTGLPADLGACHLWVIWPQGAPYVPERAGGVQVPLESGVAKHTNLTGCAPASCGGELWIDPVNPKKLYVNGCSGRYGAQTLKQLDDAVSLLQSLGYSVVSFGWDDETNLPAKVLR